MTVVVPVFNRASLILRCLDSIYAQTYRPLHVIVVDNASTDSTFRAALEWAEKHVSTDFTVEVLSESRKGAPYARQTGLNHVQTEKVMFFDSDDTMRPECIGTVMEAWKRAPYADIVAWPVVIHHESGPKITAPIRGNLLEQHLVHGIMRTQGYAVKTGFILNAGGWDGAFPVYNDYETGVRLLLNSPEIEPVNQPLVDVYPQAESITGTCYSDKAGQWEKALDAVAAYVRNSDRSDRKHLVSTVAYRKVILAATYARELRPDLALPLYGKALSSVSASRGHLLRFAYHWTRLGHRGAYRLIGAFL